MKRIITCSDGTWNKHGVKEKNDDGSFIEVETNVEMFFKCIAAEDKKGIHQVKVYDEGVGTGNSLRDRLLGGITGDGIDKNIRDVYTFICLNYKPGDEIYLLGFSRGAYTARSLAGFIYNCGILKPEHIQLVEMAYKLYRDRNHYSTPKSDMMTSFRTAYCHHLPTQEKKQYNLVPVKFIGVWDTVGALGMPLPSWRLRNHSKYKFHDEKINPFVEYAYHALAIDERRPLFSPTHFEWSDTVANDQAHTSRDKMEQRWFAGVHSNVGGGYPDYGLSNKALDWIMEKAGGAGLAYLSDARPWYNIDAKRCKEKIYNSNSLMYRLIFGATWREIKNLGADNKNSIPQTIDDSVWERWNDPKKRYRPDNLKKHALENK